jgi:hypothetical protein
MADPPVAAHTTPFSPCLSPGFCLPQPDAGEKTGATRRRPRTRANGSFRQDQFFRRGGLRAKEGLDEDLRNLAQGPTIGVVFPVGTRSAATPGQVRTRASFGENLKQRVFPPALVVVEVLIAQRDPEETLGQEDPL